MSKHIMQTDECHVTACCGLGKFAILLLLLLQASCGGEQQPSIVENTEYLEFLSIAPGPKSEFDEMYALVGDYSSPGLAVSTEHVPTALVGGTENSTPAQRLRIFHINDLHHHLSDQVGELTEYRIARISKLVRDGRQSSPEDEAVLFISAGDDAAGTRFDELIGFDSNEFIMHPGYEAYSAIGMDVSVLGNHEFDWGTELLQLSVIKSAAFPVISSNVVSSNDAWPVYGSLIGTINGYRIAFLGFTLPGALPVQSLEGRGYKVLEISAQLAKLVPVLDPYVDLFILVNHIGYNDELASGDAASANANGDVEVAQQLSELTAKPAIVVGGHSHTILNKDRLEPANLINNIPVLQAGEFGQWLGDAHVKLIRTENGVTANYSAQLIGIDVNSGQASVDTLIDTELQETLVVPMENMLLEKFRTVIAAAISAPGLSAEETAIDRYTDESAMLNILTDALIANSSDWVGGPLDFAAINATSIAGGLDAGADITYGNIFSLMPYADTVYLLKVSGQQLKEIVENNAGRVRQKKEFTSHGGALDPAQFQGRGFLQFSAGIRYAIETDPATGRAFAANISFNGIAAEKVLSDQFTLAIPRYVASGRGKWAGESLWEEGSIDAAAIDMRELVASTGYDTGRVWRNELLAYFKAHGTQISDEAATLKDGRIQLED